MNPIRTRLVHAAGVLLGAGLAVFLLAGARPSADYTSLPARVSVTVGLTGELGVTPAPPKPALASRGILPGATPAQADAAVRNQTGQELTVGFRAEAPARDLDGLLRIRLSVDGQTLADTTLQGLRAGTRIPLALNAGVERTVRVELWIPGSITAGYQGRTAAVTLTPVVRIAG
ncbi:hypothetical protein [Patulibacter americanus]|uniref:hypothetical protein n=1 Tax=Patulibacter americanus TaxID=588672 RepID=UPI0003B79E5F|nr:hypothetical protein [Patulibacter americanus]